MSFRQFIFLLAAGSFAWCVSTSVAQDVPTDTRAASISALAKKFCVECHSGDDANAGLNLEAFDASVVGSGKAWDTSHWEKIVRRLRARQMPPADAQLRPTEAEYDTALTAFESVLAVSAAAHPKPGRTDSIRRLTRTEYHNAIRDLLAIDVNVDTLLPADESGHGFDNVTVGELSPALLSRYITAAERISRLAIGGPQHSPGGTNVRLPADRTQESHVEGLPLGTRGGTVFEHQFPADGEYEIQLRLMRDRDENIEGLNEAYDIDVLVDRDLIHRFNVSPARGKGEGYEKDDTLIDANLKKRFRVAAGPHKVGATFPQKFASLSEIKRQPFEASFNRHRHPRHAPAIFEVSIVGPFDPQGPGDTPSRRRILTAKPNGPDDAMACAKQILERLIRQAYRRPVTEHDMAVPLRFFERGLAADGFEAGIEAALSAVLVNPHFLFRVEADPSEATDPANPAEASPGTVYRISDVELASRLSFFLWSSIPDDTLLRLAEAGRLHKPDVLKQQVLRMLADQRSQSLVTNFATQWLYLRNLDTFQPDRRLFADFDDNLRVAMRRETELLFEHVLHEDRSVLDLIRTDTTFLNERLAKHYGIPQVFGSEFRPVKVESQESHRGGLLRHASILAVTSYATRTSPTIRGNWVLGNLLGTPPPPPPANVPSLKEKTEAANLTIRERLAEHRANPACASCHNLMDPVGFSLENFDAVGRWRVFDDGEPIDAVGALPDGRPVRSIDELEAGIVARPQMFVGTLTEKLLTFALGRGIELEDGPAIRKVVSGAADNQYRFSSIVEGIVTSVPFQMRVVE